MSDVESAPANPIQRERGYAQFIRRAVAMPKEVQAIKGRTIIFLTGGGGTIFQRLGHNFFLNFSLSKQFFSEILVRQTIYFFNLLKSNNFFLSWVILVSMELKVI